MSAEVIDLSSRTPSVFYTVVIEQGVDGVRSIKIHDVEDSEHNRESVAYALLEAAYLMGAKK